jgi:hypothetical protein
MKTKFKIKKMIDDHMPKIIVGIFALVFVIVMMVYLFSYCVHNSNQKYEYGYDSSPIRSYTETDK